MDRYINMFINIVIRRLMTLGINKGIDTATKGRKKPEDKDLSAEQKKAFERQRECRQAHAAFLSALWRAEIPATGYLKCFDSFSPWPW